VYIAANEVKMKTEKLAECVIVFGNKKADAFGLERCDMHNIVHDYDYYESWSI